MNTNALGVSELPVDAQVSTTLLLVRHGQTRSNVTGFYMGRSHEDLDEAGYAQVRSLSLRLAALPLASVYASPLQRTRTTAEIIAKPHKLEVQELDDLLEINLGGWQGLHMDEVQKRWPEIWKQSRIDPSDVTFPGGESFKQVGERAVRAFRTIASENSGKQVVVVSHEIVIKQIIAYVLGVSTSIYRRFEITNASLNIVRLIDGKIRLVTLNDTSHLEVV
ncbi:MAG: histidine phosphatase family protein [Chloroflexi bacterium]|nr:histidine phosphatase family protein [Chloroflexota bacterium]